MDTGDLLLIGVFVAIVFIALFPDLLNLTRRK